MPPGFRLERAILKYSITSSRVLKIQNEKGLHARASAKLVEVVEGEFAGLGSLLAFEEFVDLGHQFGYTTSGNHDILVDLVRSQLEQRR